MTFPAINWNMIAAVATILGFVLQAYLALFKKNQILEFNFFKKA